MTADLDLHPRLGPENEHRRSRAPGGAGLHILVAEGDPVTAATLAVVLRRDGHRVQLAPDGPTAVARAQGQPPDVVLLDIIPPGLDGGEVARRLPPPQQALAKRPFLIAVGGPGMGAAPPLVPGGGNRPAAGEAGGPRPPAPGAAAVPAAAPAR